MNLSDLRDELDLRAHDLTADASAISAGVAGKVRATKQRRVAAGGVAACAVAAMVGLTMWSGMKPPSAPAPAVTSKVTLGADGLPSRAVQDAPGDVVKDGLRYRAKVADDRLAVGFIGDKGQGQATLLWEPTTTHVSIAAECYLPGADTTEAQALVLRVGLAGTEGFFGGPCQAGLPQGRDLPASGVIPGEPGQGWSELAVGSNASLRVQLVDAKSGKPTSAEGVQITAAVYELGTRAMITDEAGKTVAALPYVIEHQGYAYRIREVVDRPLAHGALPEITTPEGQPFLVAWGSAGTDVASAGAGSDVGYLQLTGLDEESSLVQAGGWSTVTQRTRGLGSAAIRIEGPRPTQGTAFLVTYVPIG